MRNPILLVFAVLLAGLPVSCGRSASSPPSPIIPQPTAIGQETVKEAGGVEDTQGPEGYPLSEPGPYRVGVVEFSSWDASREGREVGVRVWYPAVWPEGERWLRSLPEAEPDPRDAPYPLVLSSAKTGAILAPYVVSHGFVWVGVTRIDTYAEYDLQMIDQPLDIVFALDQVASNPPAELAGMINAEWAGATGYSFDGYNALALSGARIDPEFHLAQCSRANATAEAILSLFPSRYQCALARDWEGVTSHAGEAITSSDDGLWRPMTDGRIRAVMPLAAEGWLLFGDTGLAAVDRPTLLIVATGDELYAENALILEKLGTSEKGLISFVGPDHMMVYNPEMVARMAHFVAAFFGYYLQGREDLAWYFSEEYVSGQEDLVWGVYGGE